MHFPDLAVVFTITNKTGGNNWSSVAAMIGQFFFLIVVFIGVLYLAYLSTRFVAKSKINAARGENIKVIESVFVGGQASVQLIKVGEQFFLISASKDNVVFLTEVKAEGIVENTNPEKNTEFPFEKHLKGYISKFRNKK